MSITVSVPNLELHPADGLYVVEADDGQAYLGRVAVDRSGGVLRVLTGLRGRPAVLDLDEIEEIHAAAGYPGIVM